MALLLALVHLVGPNRSVEIFGVKLVGVNADNGRKLLFTIVYLAVILTLSRYLRRLTGWLFAGQRRRADFWARQIVHLVSALLIIVGLISIWFNDPGRFATFFGLVSAGLAFALQRVVTSIAGYFVILRGRTFNVGDRIVMGGVRGDVIALGFIQTTIMEMGEPPAVQEADPAMWVHARQYTGRIVTIPNAKVFDEAIYNYTREFPYLWEELRIPITYQADRAAAERILLDAAARHTVDISRLGEPAIAEMERRYMMKRTDLHPSVYYRLTDNWLELSVRFLAHEHGIRRLKDRMSRQIIDAFDQAGIGIASGTYDIVGLPPVTVQLKGTDGSPLEKPD